MNLHKIKIKFAFENGMEYSVRSNSILEKFITEFIELNEKNIGGL